MADIVSSLFGLSPLPGQEIEQQARARDLELGSLYGNAMINPYGDPQAQQLLAKQQASQFALGGALTRGLGGMFGLQTPELKRATDYETILQSTQQELGEQVNNPAVLYPALQQKLAQAGFNREAMQVGAMGQKAIQEASLNQAKILTEQAQLAKATLEKRFVPVGKNVWDSVKQSWVTPPKGSESDDEVLSTDKLMSKAISILEDPKASKEDKDVAKRVYDKILPTKQPGQITQPTPIQVTDREGNVRLVNPVTREITDLGAVGKPSATFEKMEGAKKKAAIESNYAITQLQQLLSENAFDKATGSGLGSLVDKGAGFFGIGTEGATANAAIAPVADLILKQVPRFEGPQSDKDTASYKEAAGNLADPTKPADVKKAAAKKIIELMSLRQGQFLSKEDEGTEADPLYNVEAKKAKPNPTTTKAIGNKEYKRYIDKFNEYKGNPAAQRALTEAARKAGVVK